MDGHGAAIEQVSDSVVFELTAYLFSSDPVCLFRLVKFLDEEDYFGIYY